MKRFISVIAMTGSVCNISCSYCYVAGSRKNEKKFDFTQIKTLIKNCSIGFDGVEFCWHGGEPLLAGVDFYNAAVKIQCKENEFRKINYKNNIQSNGILLNNFWMGFFDKYDFRIGLSFDAPLDIHLIHRRFNVEKIIAACDLVKKHNRPLNLICVVSKLNVGRAEEIFNFFNSIGVNSYSFLPLRKMPILGCPPIPTNEELFELYKETFELWLKKPNQISSIEPLETIIKSLLGNRPKLCSFSSSCLKRMITINQDGNVVPCSSLVSDEFVLGNVLCEPLIQIINNKKSQRYRKIRSQAVKKLCNKCEFISVCRGGCRADAFWSSGNYNGEYPYCEARKKIFTYIKTRLNEVIKRAC